MRRHSWLALWVVTGCLGACFRELGSVRRASDPLPELTLEVRDQSDALWAAESAPRLPLLALHGDQDGALEPEHHLFLLRGAPSAGLLADLRSTNPRATTEMAQIALSPAPCADALCALPREPLEPGARYTLVWSAVAGVLQFPIVVSRSPAAGAAWADALPAELSGRVPTNLARALVRFDGYLAPERPRAALRDAAGREVAANTRLFPCVERALPAGDCLELVPDAPLAPDTRHSLRFEGPLRDVTGAPLSTRELSFTTGPERDQRAPSLRALDCAKDERPVGSLCVLAEEHGLHIRARSDESGTLTLSSDGTQASAIGAGTDFALWLSLPRSTEVHLSLADLAGNEHQTSVMLAPAPDLATITIDEVRVDPLGPEPAQEYVELLNFGANDVSMQGFSLTQDPFAQGQAISGGEQVAPGERVLVVAPDFDARESSDGALPPGVRLLRLTRPLALRNDGSAIFLRDALGRRLSAAPALAPEQPGQCIYRYAREALRSGTPLAFARDASGGCTPGAASSP